MIKPHVLDLFYVDATYSHFYSFCLKHLQVVQHIKQNSAVTGGLEFVKVKINTL